MSTETGADPPQDTPERTDRTVIFTGQAQLAIERQLKHTAQVGEAFGYDSTAYLTEVLSLHTCLTKVIMGMGPTARVSAVHWRKDELSLEVEEISMTIGMIFFPGKHEQGTLVAGEYSLHS